MSKRIKDDLRETMLSLLASGEKTGLTARNLKTAGIEVTVPEFKPDEITAVRNALGYSQDVFAQILGINKLTVSKWERGVATPSGTASVLLAAIQRFPEILRWRLETTAAAPAKQKSKDVRAVAAKAIV